MSATVHRRSPMRKDLPSPRRRNSPHHGRSPDHHRILTRDASPVRNNSSRRARSPPKEKLHDQARSSNDVGSRNSRKDKAPELTRSPRRRESESPTKVKLRHHNRSPARPRSRSPIRTDNSRSPSPRTKCVRHAEANRGSERLVDTKTTKSYARENDKERQKERSDDRDFSEDRRTIREKVDRVSSRVPRHDRSNSPEERNHRRRYGSRSPSTTARTLAQDEERSSREPGHHRAGVDDSVSRMNATQEALETKEKQKPSFELSGKLAEETNRSRGVTLLFTEPPDARKPDIRWRLYVFKGGEVLNDPLYVHRQSCYLFGRERRVADIPTDHPSCSKQHAVLQYRVMEREQPDGLMKKQVRPYLMDLGSTNGTFINDNRVEPQRYYELFEKDTIKFGTSSREYVLLHESSVQ